MDREINYIEFLFTFKHEFSITPLSSEMFELKVENLRKVTAYQGWDIGTARHNEDKRKIFNISLGHYIQSIEKFNKNHKTNKYTPSLVLKVKNEANPYLMTVTDFKLGPESLANTKEVLKLTVKTNYLDSDSDTLYGIDGILNKGLLDGVFMLTGFDYGVLNNNKHFDNDLGTFSLLEQKQNKRMFDFDKLIKETVIESGFRSMNFLYNSNFDVELNDSGNLVLKHRISEETPHLYAFQGWDKYTSYHNNDETRELKSISLHDFSKYVQHTRDEVASLKDLCGYGDETIAINQYSFQPTCVLTLDDKCYYGVAKNFTYETILEDLTTSYSVFTIELSLKQMDSFIPVDPTPLIGANKEILINIDPASESSCESPSDSNTDSDTYTKNEIEAGFMTMFAGFESSFWYGANAYKSNEASKGSTGTGGSDSGSTSAAAVDTVPDDTDSGSGDPGSGSNPISKCNHKLTPDEKGAIEFGMGLASFFIIVASYKYLGRIVTAIKETGGSPKAIASMLGESWLGIKTVWRVVRDTFNELGGRVPPEAANELDAVTQKYIDKYKEDYSKDFEGLNIAKEEIPKEINAEKAFMENVKGATAFKQVLKDSNEAGNKSVTEYLKENKKPEQPSLDASEEEFDQYVKDNEAWETGRQEAYTKGRNDWLNDVNNKDQLIVDPDATNPTYSPEASTPKEVIENYLTNLKTKCSNISQVKNNDSFNDSFFSDIKMTAEQADRMNTTARKRVQDTKDTLNEALTPKVDENGAPEETTASELLDAFEETPLGKSSMFENSSFEPMPIE